MEQPKPSEYDPEKPDILLIVADECPTLKSHFLKRREKGIETYGTPLQPFNGRNAFQDLLDELLDACVYAKQAFLENPNRTNDINYSMILNLTELIHERLKGLNDD